VGVLHTPALRIDTSRSPLLAAAAQNTLPFPSLVQLGSEKTVPVRIFHVPHESPLNVLTMMADLLLRTAHATCPVMTGAQDGLPVPVRLMMKKRIHHEAHAAGAIS